MLIAARNITVDLFEFLSDSDLQALIEDMRERCLFKKFMKSIVITTEPVHVQQPYSLNSDTIDDWVSLNLIT